MNIYALPPIASALLFLLLGVFIFISNKKSKINLTFFLVCLCTAWWQFSWFILFNMQDKILAFWLVRVGYVGIILIPITFFHFFIYFLKRENRIFDKILLYFSYLIGLIFEVSLFTTNYFVAGYYQYFWGFYPRVSWLHLIYLALLLFILFRILYLLFTSLKAIKNQKKIFSRDYYQIKHILLAMIFYAFAAVDFLVNYGLEFYPPGFIFIIIFLIFIAYVIIKSQFLDVKLIATQIFTSFLASITFIQIFSFASLGELIVKIFIFLITLFFAVLLVRSVNVEVKRREEMEQLAQKLKKTTQKLAKANEGLKQLDNAKSEFISIASHQLRTPLSAVKGFISMILDGDFGPLSAKIKNGLAKVYISNERLIRLVDDLLDITRIESGKQKFKFTKVHLEDLVKPIIEQFKTVAKLKKLKLVFHQPAKPTPLVNIDADKLHEVMMNFIDNAIKYTKKGKVEVFVKPEPKGLVTFRVKDTGMGIAPDVRPFLFQKFSRGEGSFLVHTEGLGLGLYVAKMMIDAHKGKIWAESEGVDRGSSFCFSLPVAKAEK